MAWCEQASQVGLAAKVNSGKWQQAGVADVLLWWVIESKMQSHPEMTNQQLANNLQCSRSLIKKVKRWLQAGERGPQEHGSGVKKKMEEHHVELMVALVEMNNGAKGNTFLDVQKSIEEWIGK